MSQQRADLLLSSIKPRIGKKIYNGKRIWTHITLRSMVRMANMTKRTVYNKKRCGVKENGQKIANIRVVVIDHLVLP